jgi:16S rRNA (guanine(966)-N(2))-methyltransferase RsmD
MRVISGKAKGRRLTAPPTLKVRPVTDKVKEALFNILGEIEGIRALDLFAGSGSVGIEALSRGALSCCFVESDRRTASFLKKNLISCRLEEAGHVLTMTVPSALRLLSKKREKFDLVFVDPPYDRDFVNPTLKALEESDLLSKEGWIVVEHSPREMPEAHERLEIFDQRRYGQTWISFLKRISN